MSVPLSTAATKIYDLVVLGAGSGGLEAAWNSAVLHNAKVAVIEPQLRHGPPLFSALGGTCVNVGCIPKKLMYYAAEQRISRDIFSGLGWKYSNDPVIDWTKMMEKKDAIISDINESYIGMFRDTKNLDLIQGWGVINSDAKSVRVYDSVPKNTDETSHMLQTKHILISTGSWPFQPPFEGIEHTITSNEFFYLQEKPKKAVIVGGGYIAMEFLSMLNGLGVEETHLVYRGNLPLKGFDVSVRTELLRQLHERKDMTLHLEDTIVSVSNGSSGKTVRTVNGKTLENVDCVIVCTGRRPRTAGIGLEDAGISLDSDTGAVTVDNFNRTNVDRVWAVGDVTDRVSLTPVAIHEGRCVADSMFGSSLQSIDHRCIPKAVFSIPSIACVGLTEEEVIAQKIDAEVYMTKFTPLKYNAIPEGNTLHKAVIKMIVRKADKVVIGVHMLESSASEAIQSVAVCIRMQAKISDFYSTIGLHPSSAEELCSMREPSYFLIQGKKCDTVADQ
uniref:Trypanothione reductase n=1 Tax=Paramoeba aestuarina TaxID=180227 RepID=A0A7S4L7B8_9EUKA|mmetsp:Transcript_32714/g.51130  ORF Transcript_32714/g.51130 Transcript_32714/m.51130 type:complete len:502 (+) Transcript_32714:22-1527(+)